MSELLIGTCIGLVLLFWWIRDLFSFIEDIDDGMAKNSRIGESPLDRQLREKRWLWYSVATVMIFLAVIGGVILLILHR